MNRPIYYLTNSRWIWFFKGLPSFPRARALFLVRRYTMTSPERCRSLWDSCKLVLGQNVPGCFVECGVWKGGSSGLMALAINDAGQKRHLHMFDSFEGLPDPTEKDGKQAVAWYSTRSGPVVREPAGKNEKRVSASNRKGEEEKIHEVQQCRADMEGVRHLILDKIKMPEELTHFHVGWFQSTLPADAGQLGPIALLRLDGDWYDSTKICLEHLYPLLSPGGVIILDDYYSFEGCQKATDEYRNLHQIECPICRIDGDAVYWLKK